MQMVAEYAAPLCVNKAPSTIPSPVPAGTGKGGVLYKEIVRVLAAKIHPYSPPKIK